jgi:hypothetical protein
VSLAALALALDLAAVAPPLDARCAIAVGDDPVAVEAPGRQRHCPTLTVAKQAVRAIRPGAANEEPSVEVAGTLRFHGRLAHRFSTERFRFHLTRAVASGGLRLARGTFADELEALGPSSVRATVRLPGRVELDHLVLPCDALVLGGVSEREEQHGEGAGGNLRELTFREQPEGPATRTVRLPLPRMEKVRVVERRGGQVRVELRAGETLLGGWTCARCLAPPLLPIVPGTAWAQLGCWEHSLPQPPVERRAAIAPGTPVRESPFGGPAWATVGERVVVRVRLFGDQAALGALPGLARRCDEDAWVPASSLADP